MCVLRFSYAMMEVTDGSSGVLLITLVNSAAACKPKHDDALNCKCCAQRVNMSQVTQLLQRDCENDCQTPKQVQQVAFTTRNGQGGRKAVPTGCWLSLQLVSPDDMMCRRV